ncbi:GIY-YIG nuclease family protein [Clostridium gasigenes]|uniref:GIY-YIG nuclease family protein n=1 Tax=Clostridium gasigenes TaxID=94869 RepID=UPI001C0D41D8|nr:GIY-YIG nuclease family protein [Clostridium gasigenes]MBU3104791.1 GIY-YIG nuclease family protein [Clostridium gasigenes]MBU3108581.1 GIY-YIG nuclease family protein [Clostridium gasigenes]MBU3137210.1 GIY-YIG nuclease family protein [Clostridium gasigenes]
MNYMYILKCSDSSLYTGWTNDLDKRFKVHSQGKGAKYTKGRLPVELVYFEEFDNKIEAMKREYEVKQLSRKEKQKLIIENGYKKD